MFHFQCNVTQLPNRQDSLQAHAGVYAGRISPSIHTYDAFRPKAFLLRSEKQFMCDMFSTNIKVFPSVQVRTLNRMINAYTHT